MPSTTELRERLLQVALELIAEGGLKALSIRAVARRAAVSHQAPYHYFQDREHLLAAVCTQGFERMNQAFAAALARAPADPVGRLEELGRGYLGFALAHRAHYSLMFRAEVVRHEQYPELQAASQRAFSILVESVEAIGAAGKARPGDPRELSIVVWSTVHGAASLWLDGALSAKGPTTLSESTLVELVAQRAVAIVTADHQP